MSYSNSLSQLTTCKSTTFPTGIMAMNHSYINNEATLPIEKLIARCIISVSLIICFENGFHLSNNYYCSFGFFHGYADVAEMPETNTVLKYISGYAISALKLNNTGMLISKFIQSQNDPHPWWGYYWM